MADQKLSRWGIGPKMAVPSILYTAFAIAASLIWPGVFMFHVPVAARVVGIALIGYGVPLWVAGGAEIMKGYNAGQLVTTGPCALVRHPIYAAWISLIFPGIALLVGSWPMFLTPFVAYAIFKRLIHVEDDYLEHRFGQAYLDYRQRANEVLPIPRFWRKRG